MTIDQFNFAGKKAIVRVDFNVPLDENGNVTDDTRIRGALPTLKKILADGGAVIMMSHMGKPKGKVNPKLSLSQIVAKVSERLGVEVKFAEDCGNATEAAASASALPASLANFTSTPNAALTFFTICDKESSGLTLPLGLPMWLIMMRAPPSANTFFNVGRAPRIRVSSVTLPLSSNGTLKSTRTIAL